MTVELAIEEDICKALKEVIFDYPVEPFSGDFEDALTRAKRNSKGLILVAHAYDSATYDAHTRRSVLMTLPFAINIMSNDKRGSVGVMEILDKIRNTMLNYSFYKYSASVVAHQIDPTRFPDLQTGVFRAELNIEIKVDLIDLQTKVREKE